MSSPSRPRSSATARRCARLSQWPAGLGDMEEFLPVVPDALHGSHALSLRLVARRQAGLRRPPSKVERQRHARPALRVRGRHRSLLRRGLPARRARTHHRGHAAQHHRPAQRPERPQQQEEAGRRAGPGRGRHQRLTRLRLFAGPKAMDVLTSIHATGAGRQADGPSLEPLIQFGWLTVIAKPLYLALRFLDRLHGVDNWGWAIIIVTVIFNLLHAAHALHDDEVVAEDDAHSAQGGGPQEALRPSQDERPQEGRDEHRDDGALQERGREHVRRLPAHADPDAALLRLLPRAAERRRAAPGPLVLAHRSFLARPAAHSADPHHRHHVPDAVHHAVAGHGSRRSAA